MGFVYYFAKNVSQGLSGSTSRINTKDKAVACTLGTRGQLPPNTLDIMMGGGVGGK